MPNIGACRLVDLDHHNVYVQLRSPEFGNKHRLTMNRINRETRGGTLLVFADPMWPKMQSMVLTFSGLEYATVQAYLTFIKNHLGLEVGFVDWEGFYWKGIVVDPIQPTVQDGKDRYTITFEFQCQSATWVP